MGMYFFSEFFLGYKIREGKFQKWFLEKYKIPYINNTDFQKLDFQKLELISDQVKIDFKGINLINKDGYAWVIIEESEEIDSFCK
jgi:hypothetical protein